MRRSIGQFGVRLKGLASLSKNDRAKVVYRRLIVPFRDVTATALHRFFNLRVRIIARILGEADGDRYFFCSRPRFRTLRSVGLRLAKFSHDSARLKRFVTAGLRASDDPLVLPFLASHPLSREAMAAAMAVERSHPDPNVARRLAQAAEYGAGFVVATALTGDDHDLEAARKRLPRYADDRYCQFLDSFGTRFVSSTADPQLRGIPDSGMRPPTRHRLVIAEALQDGSRFLPLLSGADQVTLIGLNETFGKSDIVQLSNLSGVGEITVEHVRSRVTRFSPEYISLHLQTRNMATALADTIAEIDELVTAGEIPFLELALADFLFFQALKPAAIAALIADARFDHIVIATDEHDGSSSFVTTLSSIRGLIDDARVEVISISESIPRRLKTSKLLRSFLETAAPADIYLPPLPDRSELAEFLNSRAATSVACFAPPGVTDTSTILFATTPNAAYDEACAQYAGSLAADKPLLVHSIGRNSIAFYNFLVAKQPQALDRIRLDIVPDQYTAIPPALAQWLLARIHDVLSAFPVDDAVVTMARNAASRIAKEVIFSFVSHSRFVDAYFTHLGRANALPALVVVAPVRSPQVGVYCAAARRHGVPSLALEANALDSQYARYSKLQTDYYGVIAGYFRDQAGGFGIPRERTFVIGTPRIIRPEAYDLTASRQSARTQLATSFGCEFNSFSATVSYFGQPTAWDLVSKTWRSVIEAAKRNRICVLLKPHPEETPSRVRQYQSIVAEMDADDVVRLVSGSPADIICASDIVLTGYSTAAIDAAVLGVPVICVTDGPADYPLPQHQIIDTVLTRSADELAQEFAEFLKNPDILRKRVAAFLEREPQFVTGPDRPLRDLVAHIMALPPSEAIRKPEELPPSIFLDEPHPTFAV